MNRKTIVSIVLAVVIVGAGWLLYVLLATPEESESPANTATTNSNRSSVNVNVAIANLNNSVAPESAWQRAGRAIAGTYADADIVDLGNGQWRLYYSIEPEVVGNKFECYSAVSSDGVNWTEEAGVRREFGTFPDVVHLADGRWRMYFQNSGVIKSAISDDGLEWTDESGTRVDATNDLGLTFDNVAAPTTKYINGQYVMVYRGTIAERYATDVPNSSTQLFLWATSPDGLTFEKRGLFLDSRNTTFDGLLDGPELVTWNEDTFRLYFWSYTGVYHVEFANLAQVPNELGISEPVFDYTTSTATNVLFPPNPPGDPTLAQIAGTWFMYYGVHTEGIDYATLE